MLCAQIEKVIDEAAHPRPEGDQSILCEFRFPHDQHLAG